MSNVKTAISIQKELFEQADSLASEMRISRSQLFALALEDFLRRHQNQKLLREINAAYDIDAPEESEREAERSMRRHQRRIMEGEW